MYNTPLMRRMNADIDSFTSVFGIRVRRFIHKPWQQILRLVLSLKRGIVIESYPTLEKGVPYIFASNHSFVDDIISNLSVVDRGNYVLVGTTDQLEHNPQMIAGWVNGMIYVNKLDKTSRKESVQKMLRILRAGTSIVLFPEGVWNNTENLLCQKLFSGVYTLSKETQIPVIPVSCFCEYRSTVFYRAGKPLRLYDMSKEEALRILRDAMATLLFEQIEQHAIPMMRTELRGDPKYRFMLNRKREYMETKWTRDVWAEETDEWKDNEHPLSKDVRASFDSVRVNHHNAKILAPILLQREEDRKYDFLRFMKSHWND